MALIACPECQSQISPNALNCPKCGYPIAPVATAQNVAGTRPRGRGWIVFLCIAIPLLLIGGVLALGLGIPYLQKAREAREGDNARQLVGKWREQGASLTLDFFPDGTLRMDRSSYIGKGTYKILPAGKITLTLERTGADLWNQFDHTARFEVEDNGEELVLTPDRVGTPVRFRRLHPERTPNAGTGA